MRSAYEIAINSAWPFAAARIRRKSGYAHPSNVPGLPSQSISSRYRSYRRSGVAIGRGRSSRASIRRKADIHAPMPKPSDRIAAAEVTFLFASCRHPKTASARSESSQATSRTSRLRSACRIGEPKERRASAESRPCSTASARCDLQLFFDLTARTIAAEYVCDAGPK